MEDIKFHQCVVIMFRHFMLLRSVCFVFSGCISHLHYSHF
jgi:hypothetical protein